MVKICYIHRVIWWLRFSLILITIDPWLIAWLVHDLYLKTMKGHGVWLIVITLLCTFFSFSLQNFIKWPRWLGLWTISLVESFNHIKILALQYLIWLYEWLQKVFILYGINYFPKHGIRAHLKNCSYWWSRSWACIIVFSKVYYFFQHFGLNTHFIRYEMLFSTKNAFL